MAYAGQIIENPPSGERVKWHTTAGDSGGALVRFELWCRPGGGVPMTHVHRRAEERFEVLEGTLGVEIDGIRSTLVRGGCATVPAGAAHRYWNAGDDELHVVVEVSPALHFEQVMETLFGLARDGRSRPDGVPGLLQLAVIHREFGDEVTVPGIAGVVLRVVAAVLAPIGRLAGRRATYEAYSGPVTVQGSAS
jgi:mannose-6-phosphate isomerase-like protein (cupin superfamily)